MSQGQWVWGWKNYESHYFSFSKHRKRVPQTRTPHKGFNGRRICSGPFFYSSFETILWAGFTASLLCWVLGSDRHAVMQLPLWCPAMDTKCHLLCIWLTQPRWAAAVAQRVEDHLFDPSLPLPHAVVSYWTPKIAPEKLWLHIECMNACVNGWWQKKCTENKNSLSGVRL